MQLQSTDFATRTFRAMQECGQSLVAVIPPVVFYHFIRILDAKASLLIDVVQYIRFMRNARQVKSTYTNIKSNDVTAASHSERFAIC